MALRLACPMCPLRFIRLDRTGRSRVQILVKGHGRLPVEDAAVEIPLMTTSWRSAMAKPTELAEYNFRNAQRSFTRGILNAGNHATPPGPLLSWKRSVL